MTVRPAKTQISLGIRPVWSESSLCAQWVAEDQAVFMRTADAQADLSLRWAHSHFVGFVMSRLIASILYYCMGPCKVGPLYMYVIIGKKNWMALYAMNENVFFFFFFFFKYAMNIFSRCHGIPSHKAFIDHEIQKLFVAHRGNIAYKHHLSHNVSAIT